MDEVCPYYDFSIHSTNAFIQVAAIMLRNSSKVLLLVDLVQVYSLTSLSRISVPLLVAL